MKGLKLDKNKKQEFLIDEESPEYWDEHDSSEILGTGERIKLEIARPEYLCQKCESSRIRRRMIDLPLLNGRVVFKRTKILYCADCKTSVIEEQSLEELKDELGHLATMLDTNTLLNSVKEAVVSYEKKWTERANERKVVSIYFPTKKRAPAKAQISLSVSDPLYPKLRSLTSEDVRKKLGLQYFEDLEREASKQNRTISQYLKLELAKITLNGSLKADVTRTSDLPEKVSQHAKDHIITILPRKVEQNYLQAEQLEPPRLAARAEEGGEIHLIETSDKKFMGILKYDYGTANLFIEVVKNVIGLNVFDVELFMSDKKVLNREGLEIENNRILLIPETEYTNTSVSKIVFKMRN